MRLNKLIFFIFFTIKLLFCSDFINLNWGNIENIKEVPKTYDSEIPYIKIEEEKNILRDILDKGCKIEDFKVYPTGQIPKFKPKAYICYDNENLIIYFESEKSENYSLKARKFEKEEGKVWNDDNFEIFIDPFFTKKRYYQIIINSIGEIYDSVYYVKEVSDPKGVDPRETKKITIGDAFWNSKAQYKINVQKNYWSVLLKIPFSSFGFKKVPSGSFIGINLCRNYWEIPELAQWKLTPGEGGFHQPDKFGLLKLKGTDNKNLTMIILKNSFPGYGENLLYIEYEKKDAINEKCEVEINVENLDTKETFSKKEVVVLKDKKGIVKVPFENKWKGQNIFYYLISFKDNSFGDIDFIDLKNLMDVKLDNYLLYPDEKKLNGKIRLYLGEGTLKKAELLFSLNDKNKMGKIKGNLCEFSLNAEFLKEGENNLSIILYEDQNKLEEYRFKIFKLPKIF